jgi:hypothetical protein
MNSRTFASSIRPPKAPRHEAGFTPRHSIPCRYFARGYCSRGESCMFSHSFYDPTQSQGLQGNHHAIVPFWNSYTTFSPQPCAKRPYEIRRPSLSPDPIIVPPPSPSSSSVTTSDESSPIFNSRLPEGSSPTPSITAPDIMPANATLAVPTRASIPANGDTSCDEFSTTRSDVTRDEFLSPSTDVHFAEFYSFSSYPPAYLTPVPYVQRGFGFRDARTRGRDNRRRRTRAKLTSQQRGTSGSPAPVILQGAAPHKSGTISDSDSASVKPHQETWRVIGGGVMLGTPTSTTSRRKLKRLEVYARVAAEERSNGSYDESLELNPSTDESLEFSNLVASVKLTIIRPPLPDIIERPKSSFPPAKVSPLAAFFTHAEVA